MVVQGADALFGGRSLALNNLEGPLPDAWGTPGGLPRLAVLCAPAQRGCFRCVPTLMYTFWLST